MTHPDPTADAMREALEALRVAAEEWERWRVEHKVSDTDLQRYAAKVCVADLLNIFSALSAARTDRDGVIEEWMTCESRAAWVRNSFKDRIDDWTKRESQCRKAYTKDWMKIPANYLADAYAEATALFQRRLDALTIIKSAPAAPEGQGK